jgi:hypothetical protein
VGRGGIQVPVGVGVPVGSVYWREPYGKQLHSQAVAVAIAACSLMIPSLHPVARVSKASKARNIDARAASPMCARPNRPALLNCADGA